MNRKRQIAAAAAFLLSAASVRVLMAEEPQLFRYTVHASGTKGTGLSGAVYAVYLDEECTDPLLDETGNPEEITSGSDGTAELSALQNPVFLKEVHAPEGYYRNDSAVRVDTSETAEDSHEPVAVLTELPEECSAVLTVTDTGEEAAEWKDGKWINEEQQEYVFLSNTSYTVKQKDEPWIFYPQQQIVIPDLYDPEIQISIVPVNGQSFGKIHVMVPEEAGFSYAVYAQKEGTVPVRDITGSAAEENEIRLSEGTYYLKWTSIPDTYWQDSGSFEITVSNGQVSEVNCSFEVPLAELHALSAEDGSEITSGNWYLKDQNTGEAFCTAAGENGASVQLKREHIYDAVFLTDSGYYPAVQQVIEVPAEKTGLKAVVQCTPITLEVCTRDTDSGELLSDVSYALYDGSQLLGSWSGSRIIANASLKPSGNYRVEVTGLPDGYLPPPDVRISIPENDPGTVFAEANAVPYVHWSLDAAEHTEVSLYSDAGCTVPAQDINGNDLGNTRKADLFSGTYYARISTLDAKWYAMEDSVEICVSRNDGAEAITQLALEPVVVKIAVKDDEGALLTGVKCILKDSKGNNVKSWTSSSQEYTAEGLSRNSVYELQVESAPGLYTYRHEPVAVTVPGNCPENEPSAEITLVPYISFCISGTDGTAPAGNVLYSLYLDEEGKHPAKDIRGNTAEDCSGKDGKVWFSLRKGTYWLKAVSQDPHVNGEEQMQKIILDGSSWSAEAECLFRTCAFRFVLEDEEGNAVSGAQIMLMNENRETVYSWYTDGTEQYVSGDFLCRGSSYYLRIADVPEGYVKPSAEIAFSMPETLQEIQLLQMQISVKEKTAVRKVYSAVSVLPESSEQGEKSRRIPVFLILLTIFTGFLSLLIRRRKKQK